MPQPSVLRYAERLGQRTGRYLQQQAAGLGLTDLEVHVLWHLRQGGRPVLELQRALAVQPSTLTSVLDRLETRGYGRREVNPQDRRSFLITLTPAGRRAATAIEEALERFEAQIRRRVRAADLQAFFAVVEAIDQVIKGD